MKYAVITGASAGIGKEISIDLASRGYGVVLVARRIEKLKEVAKMIRKENKGKEPIALICRADLEKPRAPEKIYDFCKKNKLDVEILVNNAGYGLPKPFHEVSMEDEENSLRVLGISVIALTKKFIPDFLEKGYGKIMIVSSVASFAPPSAIQTLYGPIKTFMNRFSDSININYKKKGISSTSVCPGYTVTEFHTASGTQEQMDKVPAFMKLTAKRVAKEGLNAMFAGKRISIPSKRYKVLVFLMKHFSFLVNIFSDSLTGGRYSRK